MRANDGLQLPKLGQKFYGPHHNEAMELHLNDPELFFHPDDPLTRIVTGKERAASRRLYNQLVRTGELSSGHHRLGLAFGGENIGIYGIVSLKA